MQGSVAYPAQGDGPGEQPAIQGFNPAGERCCRPAPRRGYHGKDDGGDGQRAQHVEREVHAQEYPRPSDIFYNSAILSRLLTKYEAAGNNKALALITQMSPAAWRHILLNGHYTFQSDGKMIDLDALVAGLELG